MDSYNKDISFDWNLLKEYVTNAMGTSGGVIVSKLEEQTYTSEFKFNSVPHSFDLVPNRSKELRKLQRSKSDIIQLVICNV